LFRERHPPGQARQIHASRDRTPEAPPQPLPTSDFTVVRRQSLPANGGREWGQSMIRVPLPCGPGFQPQPRRMSQSSSHGSPSSLLLVGLQQHSQSDEAMRRKCIGLTQGPCISRLERVHIGRCKGNHGCLFCCRFRLVLARRCLAVGMALRHELFGTVWSVLTLIGLQQTLNIKPRRPANPSRYRSEYRSTRGLQQSGRTPIL